MPSTRLINTTAISHVCLSCPEAVSSQVAWQGHVTDSVWKHYLCGLLCSILSFLSPIWVLSLCLNYSKLINTLLNWRHYLSLSTSTKKTPQVTKGKCMSSFFIASLHTVLPLICFSCCILRHRGGRFAVPSFPFSPFLTFLRFCRFSLVCVLACPFLGTLYDKLINLCLS